MNLIDLPTVKTLEKLSKDFRDAVEKFNETRSNDDEQAIYQAHRRMETVFSKLKEIL